MASAPSEPSSAYDRILPFVRTRVRFLAAIGLGLLTFLVVPDSVGVQTRRAIAWDSAAGLYLVLVLVMMARSDAGVLRQRADSEDESMAINVLVAIAATAFSITTVIRLLITAQGRTHDERVQHLWLCGATIMLSWFFVHVLFAVHYAHRYFVDDPARPDAEPSGGLAFPSEEAPDYWDFMYFSFVIAMTSQVSDVLVRSRHIRRAALVQGILAFFFNTVILAFTVNVAAGLG